MMTPYLDNAFVDQYLIHVFQTYHNLRDEDYPLLSTNLLNSDAAVRDVPSPIPIFDISTSVDSITASFRMLYEFTQCSIYLFVYVFHYSHASIISICITH